MWTSTAAAPLMTDAGAIPLFLFTRLEVIGRDTAGLHVSCSVCRPAADGYIGEHQLVSTHLPPEVSAWGELPEFLLSVRDAAERHDLRALQPIMAPEFSFAFLGVQSPDAAFAVWESEQYRSLDEMVRLLDEGVATRDGSIWSAPPRFILEHAYQGLRTGFRQRPDGRWEWLYLIRGVGGG